MNLQLGTDIAFCDTADAAVLLDERTGRYWQLNTSGALILRTLLAGGNIEQAALTLTHTYRVAPETADADVHALIEQLTTAALITTPTAP
jgi:hypothetical protein